jgi:flagellar basal body-associated protein FliL
MDREEEHDAKHREASRAGLLVVVLFFLMVASIGVLVGITFWPVFTDAPVTETVPKAE